MPAGDKDKNRVEVKLCRQVSIGIDKCPAADDAVPARQAFKDGPIVVKVLATGIDVCRIEIQMPDGLRDHLRVFKIGAPDQEE